MVALVALNRSGPCGPWQLDVIVVFVLGTGGTDYVRVRFVPCSAIWEKTWILLTVQVGIKIRMKHLAVVGAIKGHKVEDQESETVRMQMDIWTVGLMTSLQMLSSQVLGARVTIITGIDIDIYKKMTSWINAGKNERKLG
jgi:hypothetical protein